VGLSGHQCEPCIVDMAGIAGAERPSKPPLLFDMLDEKAPLMPVRKPFSLASILVMTVSIAAVTLTWFSIVMGATPVTAPPG
jgi:hypothetical protein